MMNSQLGALIAIALFQRLSKTTFPSMLDRLQDPYVLRNATGMNSESFGKRNGDFLDECSGGIAAIFADDHRVINSAPGPDGLFRWVQDRIRRSRIEMFHTPKPFMDFAAYQEATATTLEEIIHHSVSAWTSMDLITRCVQRLPWNVVHKAHR
jgi:hypothetical protein